MRIPYQLCGCVAAAVFLLCAAPAPATTIILPAAQYNVSVGTGSCDGFNCSKSYSKGLNSTGPAGLQVGCSADAGAPNCAGALLLAAPAPFISVGATTSLNHQSQSASADVNVTYYYEILCDTCALGTLVPLSVGGVVEAHYVQGTGGTVAFQDLARVFVNGYNSLTLKDNVLVDQTMEGLGASASDLTTDPFTPAGAPPNGFGFCESTWTGFGTCGGGPSSPYGSPIEARVNTAYSIFLDANAALTATNQMASTSSAEVTIDPVISFGPGFDSTDFSIAESPGIGNEASTVPEPATWMLLSTAVLGWGCGRMLGRMTRET